MTKDLYATKKWRVDKDGRLVSWYSYSDEENESIVYKDNKPTDLISRTDAIEAVLSLCMPLHLADAIDAKLNALPSAEAVSREPLDIFAQMYRAERESVQGGDAEALSAEAVQGWTPVKERLPKIDETLHLCDQISDEVLGTDTYGNIRHVYLTNCGYLKPTFCTVEEGMSVDIVAWMPLPKPYEEASR